MQPYLSPEGAADLQSIRVGAIPSPTEGSAPVALLARLPSEDCGCPEELWRVDGMIYLIHLEADGDSEVHVFSGDLDYSFKSKATTLDALRAHMFTYHASLIGE
jgi:hypothetical protein